MSDLFGNHIVGFPTRQLISYTCGNDQKLIDSESEDRSWEKEEI